MAHPFRKMSEDQIADFLTENRNAIIAVNREDGAPLISPVWYLYEEKSLYFSVTNDSAKHRCLKRDPQVAICIDGGHPDERAVTIYGKAELYENESDWPDDILFHTASRYTDIEAYEFVREYLNTIKSESVLVKIDRTSSKLIGRDYNRQE